jgi:hypothetical protein
MFYHKRAQRDEIDLDKRIQITSDPAFRRHFRAGSLSSDSWILGG